MTRPALGELQAHYDLVVIGGGITGAGIFREAVRSGVSVLLVEARDYASGTSSWSSKLVHGGLRYLKEGQWRLTLESVRERQRLLREMPDLVQTQSFLMPLFRGQKPGRRTMQAGLWLYDRMAGGATRSQFLPAAAAQAQAAQALRADGLLGAMSYGDARTDDARLVWRLIAQGKREGGTALNYVRAERLLSEQGRVCGLRLCDPAFASESRDIAATVVINATGVWADQLAGAPAGAPRIRPLRGSHLLFPLHRLPLAQAVSWLHPRDRRPVFAYPWQGALLYGTTDLDHEKDRWQVGISPAEVAYLMEGLHWLFPQAGLIARDALGSFSGLRPVLDDGQGGDPSAASRESAVWDAPGHVGVTGGKLTTYRPLARAVLARAAVQLPGLRLAAETAPLLPPAAPEPVGEAIPGTPWNWAQLQQRADEDVCVIGDLLLRRTRLGLVLSDGAAALLPELLQRLAHKGWTDNTARGYLEDWQRQHALPAP